MPLDVTPFYDQMSQFGFIPSNHVKPNWFPVEIGDVYDVRGKPIPNYKRVYRDDTGDTLAVHSDKYRLISYEKTFTAFDEALRTSGLNLDGMHIATDLTHNGARCFRQYLLPGHSVDVGDGDVTALRIIMFNSYDGSTMFSGMAGGYRFICANMSVLGNDLVRIGVKHIGNNDKDNKIELTIARLVAETAKAIKKIENMRKWQDIKITYDQVQQAMLDFPQVSDQLANNIITNMSVACHDNLWQFYNTLTAWSTHTETKQNHAATRSAREKRVGMFIESPAWRYLEHA